MILYYQIDDKLKSIDLPLSVDDIGLFDTFCDFRAAEHRYFKANESAGDEDSAPIALLLEAVGVIVKGDLASLPMAVDGDEFVELIESEYMVKPGDDLSLLRVYAHVVNVINLYRPETIPETFTIKRSRFPWLKAERFEVQSQPAARVIDGRVITTGEAVELLEYQRLADQKIDAAPGEIGNIEFTLGLTEVALLMRQPGESLPSSPRKLKGFLNDRKKQFKKLPLSVILSLRFFLIAALLKLKTTHDSGSFGKAPRGQTAPQRPTPKGNVRRRPRKRGR